MLLPPLRGPTTLSMKFDRPKPPDELRCSFSPGDMYPSFDIRVFPGSMSPLESCGDKSSQSAVSQKLSANWGMCN